MTCLNIVTWRRHYSDFQSNCGVAIVTFIRGSLTAPYRVLWKRRLICRWHRSDFHVNQIVKWFLQLLSKSGPLEAKIWRRCDSDFQSNCEMATVIYIPMNCRYHAQSLYRNWKLDVSLTFNQCHSHFQSECEKAIVPFIPAFATLDVPFGSFGSEDFQVEAEVRFVTLEEKTVWQSTDQERRESKTASAKWNCANGSALRVGRYPGDKSLGTPGAISGKTSPRSERTRPTWGHSWKTRYRKGTILILVSFAVDFLLSVPLRSPAVKRQRHRGFVLSSLRTSSIWQLPNWPNLIYRETQGLLTIFQLRDG